MRQNKRRATLIENKEINSKIKKTNLRRSNSSLKEEIFKYPKGAQNMRKIFILLFHMKFLFMFRKVHVQFALICTRILLIHFHLYKYMCFIPLFLISTM